MDREELVGIQTIWWVDYQLAVGFLTGSWKSNMDVWISNQLFGNPTACLSWPRCNGVLIKHTFVTKRILTFSQRALIHERNSAIQIIHASGTPICLVNLISIFFQENTGFKSNEIQL